jgi:nitroreductase
VPKELIGQLIDAGRFAATARNIQPWEFVVVSDKAMLEKIANLAENGRFIAQAAACIAVCCADTKYYLEDGCAATENILLAATNYGVGSCWVAGEKKAYCAQLKSLLEVPESFKLVSLIALGFPKDPADFRQAPKRSLKELIHWEKF